MMLQLSGEPFLLFLDWYFLWVSILHSFIKTDQLGFKLCKIGLLSLEPERPVDITSFSYELMNEVVR